MVGLPCVTQLHTKSYWTATTHRHMTSNKSGKERRCKLVHEKRTAKTYYQSQDVFLVQEENSGRPIAGSLFRCTIRRRLQRYPQRLDGNRRRLESTHSTRKLWFCNSHT